MIYVILLLEYFKMYYILFYTDQFIQFNTKLCDLVIVQRIYRIRILRLQRYCYRV